MMRAIGWILKGILLVLLGGIVLVFFVLMPLGRVHEGSVRPRVKKLRGEMKSLAAALESYRAETGRWPAGDAFFGDGVGFVETAAAITTPVAHAERIPVDPFFHDGQIRACFVGSSFLLVSPGPDGDIDILSPRELFVPSDPAKMKALAGGPWTYDPTNGTVSNGDIWRAREVDKRSAGIPAGRVGLSGSPSAARSNRAGKDAGVTAGGHP